MHDSSFGRLIGVLFAPTKTFESIRERPTWVVPLVVLVVITSLVVGLMFQKVDFSEVMEQQMAAQGRQGGPAPTAEQQEMGEKFAKGCFLVAAVLGPPIFYVILAGIYMVFNLAGGELRFPVSFSVVLHTSVPRAVGGLLAIPVILARESLTMEQIQSGNVLKSNLSFLAPEGANPMLSVLLTNLDLFALWSVVLAIVGFHVAARVKKGTSAAVVVALWLILIGVQVGFAALGAMMGGQR